MIISKTPYRVSFFGGGTDYPKWFKQNEGEVLSCTIDKFIYLSCRKLPNFFSHKYRIVYSKNELCKNIESIKHASVREILKRYHRNDFGLEIHYDGDLPARSGMGSSSSFIVGLINIFNKINKVKKTKIELAKESIYFEQKILKETVGCQDQIAASFGGFNSIKFYKNGNFKVNKLIREKSKILKLSQNLCLVYTNQNRTANYVAKSYIHKLNNKKMLEMQKIQEHVKIAKKLVNNNDFDEFGKLLNENWNMKKRLSSKVSSNTIDQIYQEGINSGALGGKLLGAGGGGFILLYIKKKNLKRLQKKLSKLSILPIDIVNQGSEIIFDYEK